jgi:hypothetical protein
VAIIGMHTSTIVKISNSRREIEEEMRTPCKSKRSQPLSGTNDLDEESVDDEHKKQRRKNHK